MPGRRTALERRRIGSLRQAIAGVENAPDSDVAEVHTHGEEQPADAGLVEPELAKPDEESEEEPS